jgi:hypothetical protein
MACKNDFECGFREVCVKQPNTAQLNGVCVESVDEYGNSRNLETTPATNVHEIESCKFTRECKPGFSCIIKEGELSGTCVK